MGAPELLWEYRSAFAAGLGTTAALLGIATSLGTAFGVLMALASRWERSGVAGGVFNLLAFLGAAIPALVILFWAYYPAQVLLGVQVSGFTTAWVTLTLLNALAIFRIVSDGISAFPQQFLLAAKVSGLDQRVTILEIYIPILVRSLLPRWVDQQVFILHCTLLASFISVEETFRVAQRINSSIYQPVLIYTAVAMLFLLIGGTGLGVSGMLRQRLARDWSER